MGGLVRLNPEEIEENDAALAEEAAVAARETKMQRIAPTNAGLSGGPDAAVSESFGQKTLRQTGNFAGTAIDAATGGVARPINSGVGLVGDLGRMLLQTIAPSMVPEESRLSGGDVLDRAKAEWGKTNDAFTGAREELGTGLSLVAELTGLLSPASVPGKIDKGVDLLRAFAPTGKNIATRYAAGTAAQFPAAALDNYMRGDMDFEDAMRQGVFDAALGTTMQAVVGDVALPLGKRAHNAWTGGKTGYGAGAISDTGFNTEGINLGTLWNVAKSGITEGTGLLDINVGTANRGELARRAHNALAKLHFPTNAPRDMNKGSNLDPSMTSISPAKRKSAYDETLTQLGDVMGKANEEYTAALQTTIGDHADVMAGIRTNNSSAKAAGKVMGSLSRTKPNPATPDIMPIGATPINAKEFVSEVETSLEDTFGVNNLGEHSLEVQKVFNRFNNLLRGLEQETVALDWRKIESKGKQSARAGEIFAEIPLARLIAARKTLAGTISPNSMIDGSSVTKLETKATTDVLRVVDQKIDDMTYGQMGLARGAYSKAMRVEEAYKLGEDFYTQRNTTMTDKTTFAAYYDEGLEDYLASMDDPDVKLAFKQGYKKGMVELTNSRSPAVELNMLLGEGGGTAATKKSTGYNQLEAILGKDDAAAIFDLHNNGAHLIDMRTALHELWTAKGGNETGAKDFIGDVTSWAKKGVLPASFLDGGLAWMARTVKSGDKHKVESMRKLLTLEGPELAAALRKSVEAISPSGAQIGTRAAIGGGDIAAYLQSVVDEDASAR